MNPGFIIRQASSGDIGEIMEIEHTCFGVDAFMRRQMLYLISKAKGVFLVAVQEGHIVGYISFVTSNRHHTGRIYSVAVVPSFRGNGAGEKLVDEVIGYGRSKGLKAIFLEVNTANSIAISLYRKKGFSTRLMKERYYLDGSDAYSMVLIL